MAINNFGHAGSLSRLNSQVRSVIKITSKCSGLRSFCKASQKETPMLGGRNFRDGYQSQKQFASRYSSVALVFVLITYYAIVYFHIELPTHSFFLQDPFHQALVPLYAVIGIFSLVGVGIKGGYIFYTRSRADTARGLLSRFLIINFIMIIFDLCLLSIVVLSNLAAKIITPAYVQESHLFWVMIFVAVLVFLFATRMISFGLIRWSTLKDIQAVPIASPAFAFGAPFLFSKSLIVDNIPEATKTVHQSLFFASGAVFVIYLLTFFVFKSKLDREDDREPSVQGVRHQAMDDRPVKVLFILFGLGIFLLLVPIVDMIFVNQFL